MPAMELNVGSHSVLLALCAIVHLLVCHCCSWSPPPHHHHHHQQQHSSTSSASSLSTFTTASVLRLNFNVSKITTAHPAFVRHHPHVTMLAYNSCVFAVTRFSFSFSFGFCFFLFFFAQHILLLGSHITFAHFALFYGVTMYSVIMCHSLYLHVGPSSLFVCLSVGLFL